MRNYSLAVGTVRRLALFLTIAAILVPAALLFTAQAPDLGSTIRRLSLELIMAFLTGVLYTYF